MHSLLCSQTQPPCKERTEGASAPGGPVWYLSRAGEQPTRLAICSCSCWQLRATVVCIQLPGSCAGPVPTCQLHLERASHPTVSLRTPQERSGFSKSCGVSLPSLPLQAAQALLFTPAELPVSCAWLNPPIPCSHFAFSCSGSCSPSLGTG